VAAVVGSGIMAERLAGGNVALALLANSIATGAVLAALILTFGPVSGAHLNPVVSLADAMEGGLAWSDKRTPCLGFRCYRCPITSAADQRNSSASLSRLSDCCL
jgi:hypothetical protein